MLLQHIDPWQDYLAGDPAHAISRVQVPNYLPLMYVLLAPLGWLSLHQATIVWAILNIVFGLTSGILCGRFYGLDRTRCVVLVALLMISTPLRNSIGNGQQGLLVLFFWVLALCQIEYRRTGFTIGFSYCKYSFAPPVFIFLLLRLGYRAALWSLVPALAALAIVYLWLGGSLSHPVVLLHLLLAPLHVASTGYGGSPGPNLMEALEWFLLRVRLTGPIFTSIVYGLPLLIATALLFLITRCRSGMTWHVQIALLAVISVALFKHHPYDHVVLLFPMACCLKHLHRPAGRWGLALICYPWFGEKLIHAITGRADWSFAPDLAILALIGVVVSLLRSSRDDAENALASSVAPSS